MSVGPRDVFVAVHDVRIRAGDGQRARVVVERGAIVAAAPGRASDRRKEIAVRPRVGLRRVEHVQGFLPRALARQDPAEADAGVDVLRMRGENVTESRFRLSYLSQPQLEPRHPQPRLDVPRIAGDDLFEQPDRVGRPAVAGELDRAHALRVGGLKERRRDQDAGGSDHDAAS
jgi:hypothetical protein